MKLEFIKELLDRASISYKEGNKGYLSISCPFAKYSNLHKHDYDQSSSAYVRVSDEGISFFGCYTCEHTGNMWTLFKKLKTYSDNPLYTELLSDVYIKENKSAYDNTIFNINRTPSGVYSKMTEELTMMKHPIVDMFSVMYDIFNENDFRDDIEKRVIRYLTDYRNYSKSDAIKVSLDFNFKLGANNNQGIYIVRDFQNNIAGYMLFNMGQRHPNTKKYIVEYQGFNFLLNEQVFYKRKFNSTDIAVAEGLFDITKLSLSPYFKNVVGLQGHIKTQQMIKILYFSKKIYFFTDMDAVGVSNVKKLKEYYDDNSELFGYREIKIFDGFNQDDDPDSFFNQDNDIKKYDFKGKFVTASYFINKYEYLLDRKLINTKNN